MVADGSINTAPGFSNTSTSTSDGIPYVAYASAFTADEVAHARLVVSHAHGDVVHRGRIGERSAADHFRHRVAEEFQTGLEARGAQIVILAAVAHLDREAALEAAEEGVSGGHQC